jgi:hypothetical protein
MRGDESEIEFEDESEGGLLEVFQAAADALQAVIAAMHARRRAATAD